MRTAARRGQGLVLSSLAGQIRERNRRYCPVRRTGRERRAVHGQTLCLPTVAAKRMPKSPGWCATCGLPFAVYSKAREVSDEELRRLTEEAES